MARYLFTMWDGGGNIAPELAVAKKLIARGHSVRVLCDPTVEEEALRAGCSFSRWTTAPHRKSRAKEDDVLRDYETTNPLQMIDRFLMDFLARPSKRWLADTLRVLDEQPVDALVADFSVPAALIAAEARGLPRAIMLPNIWMVPTPGIPPLGPGWQPARTFLGRLRDAAMRAISRRLFNRALPHLNDARATVGLSPIASTYDQLMSAERLLVLASPIFDFTSAAMPDNVRYTGPELDDPTWCEPWQNPWPEDDDRPLILVSLSSTFQDQVSTLRRIIEAVGTLPVRVLVTLGAAVSEGEVPQRDNVVVMRSAPHSQIIPRATLVVSHCGHGTTMKALSAGVPLVCMPMGRDQNDTAARVVHAGVGVRIAPTARAEVVRSAIESVLADRDMRTRARRFGERLRAGEGCADAAQCLEEILPRKAATSSAGKVAAAAPSI